MEIASVPSARDREKCSVILQFGVTVGLSLLIASVLSDLGLKLSQQGESRFEVVCMSGGEHTTHLTHTNQNNLFLYHFLHKQNLLGRQQG